MATCAICQRTLVVKKTVAELLGLQHKLVSALCEQCRQQFSSIDWTTACISCGRVRTENNKGPSWTCTDCLRWKKDVRVIRIRNHAIYEYDEAMKNFMYQYKFIGDVRLAGSFYDRITAAIQLIKPDVIVPMPVSITTFQRRGFNQAELLLPTGLPILQALQTVAANKVAQVGRKRQERMTREQPFEPKPLSVADREQIKRSKVLIFDDVYTTGRTLRFAAQILQTFSPQSLIGLTLAR